MTICRCCGRALKSKPCRPACASCCARALPCCRACSTLGWGAGGPPPPRPSPHSSCHGRRRARSAGPACPSVLCADNGTSRLEASGMQRFCSPTTSHWIHVTPVFKRGKRMGCHPIYDHGSNQTDDCRRRLPWSIGMPWRHP